MGSYNKNNLLSAIDEYAESALELAVDIFNNPEISNEEKETYMKLVNYMKNAGFDVQTEIADVPYSFKATKKNGDGPRICYIAEYDALAGLGHACSHHYICTISCLAGIAAATVLDNVVGEVTVFGTPAEETGDGKPPMVEAGIFDGYDACLMVHPNNISVIYPPFIAIGGNDYTFTGKGSHAGVNPFDGINAEDAVVLFKTAIGLLRQQLRDGTRVHGIIQEAGTAPNAIPSVARARMEFRSDDMNYYYEVVDRVNKCAEGAAIATGCTVEYHAFEPTCENLKHNYVIGDNFAEHLEEFGVDYIRENNSRGSTDLGNVSQLIPTIQPTVQVTKTEQGIHTPQYRDATLEPFGRERMVISAKCLALSGADILTDSELRQAIWEDFNRKK